jgi:hypothetical protein
MSTHNIAGGIKKPKGIKSGKKLSDAFELRLNFLKSRGGLCVYFDTIENILSHLSDEECVIPKQASKKAIHVAFVYDDYQHVDILATKEVKVSKLLNDWATARVQSSINFGCYIDAHLIKSDGEHDHYYTRLELSDKKLVFNNA